jgi:hypothetical protein
MLPGNSIVSAVSKVLLEKCLAITARDNIVASNPYKDQETLELIKTHGISKVVVNTADEVEKIQMYIFVSYAGTISMPTLSGNSMKSTRPKAT